MTTPITLPHSTSHTVLVALLEGACHAASVLRGNLELLARERQHAEQPYAYVEAAETCASDLELDLTMAARQARRAGHARAADLRRRLRRHEAEGQVIQIDPIPSPPDPAAGLRNPIRHLLREDLDAILRDVVELEAALSDACGMQEITHAQHYLLLEGLEEVRHHLQHLPVWRTLEQQRQVALLDGGE